MKPRRDSRLSRAFCRLRRRVEIRVPELSGMRLRICPLADREHEESWRRFAHTLHRYDTICFAAAAETELTDRELYGILAHEFGHLIADRLNAPAHLDGSDEDAQAEADLAAAVILDVPVRYNERALEEVSPSRLAALRRGV